MRAAIRAGATWIAPATCCWRSSNMKSPALVIVCDDAALEFLLEYPQLLTDVPVVFGGVQDRNLAARAPRDRYTGIIEQFRIDDVITAGLRARPATRRIFVATGNNRVGEAFRAEFDHARASSPQLSFVALSGDALTFEQILERLRGETTPTTS